MGHIFCTSMQKGGVGKTTTTQNVGVNLYKMGAKVLLVDLDPQANLSLGLGVNLEALEYSVYEVLLNPGHGSGFATITTDSGVDLIPSTLALAGAELELAGKVGREMLLKRALASVVDRYDYIIIDSPPNLGLFTLNAIATAHKVLVPLQLHVYAFRAMPQLEATIELVRQLNPEVSIGGIVGTMYDGRTNLSKSVERQVRAKYGDLVFQTMIPLNTKLAESPAAGEPISIYDPEGAGAIAYAKLTREVVSRYGFK
jgi:chromosome partitioning protein